MSPPPPRAGLPGLARVSEAGGSPQGSGATRPAWHKPSGCDFFFPGQQVPGTSFKNTLGRDQVPILYLPLPDDLHPTSSTGISNSHHPFLPTWLLFLVPQTFALFPQAVTLSPHLTGILFLFFIVLS